MNHPASVNQVKDPQTDQPPTDHGNWRDERRIAREQRREERHAARGSGAFGWSGGVLLILIGAVYLFQNMTGYRLFNWWALFFVLPAIGAFLTAWNNYRSSQRLTRLGRSALVSGLILSALAAGFLFDLNMTNLWPVLIILAGISLLVSTILP